MSGKKIGGIFNDFAGLPIKKLLANPLVAVARAQNMMARAEIYGLLHSCFRYEDGIYYPIMLEMSLDRSFLDPGVNLHCEPMVREIKTVFSVPLITLFPISSLGVDFIVVGNHCTPYSKTNQDGKSKTLS